MNPDEIDIQIHELENRIDRLRALYEQYFMGFERTEPAVPRKDVERRIHDLRKVRFNNTAKRFKFQTLIQRYNTMQQYWGRICREIENGTYKRHKLKAERTIGALDDSFFDGSLRAPALGSDAAEEKPAEKGSSAREAANLAAAAAELLDANADLDAELKKALSDAEVPKPAAMGAGLLARLGKRSGEESSAAQVSLPNAPRPKGPTLPLPPLGAPKPKTEDRVAPAPQAPKPELEPKEQPKVPSWRPIALTDDSSRARMPTPRPSAEPGAPVVVRPTVPVTHASSRPPPPGPSPDQAKSPAIPRPPLPPRPQTSLAPAEGARPPGPPPRPAPRTSSRPESKRPPRRDEPSSLSDERIQKIHEGYQRARAETNAAPVTLEKLAKSLRDTEAQLIAKSNGRKVDFEVVVEAGRAMLKPKIQ